MNERPNASKRAQINNLCPGLVAPESEVERLFAVLDRYGGFDAPDGSLSIAFVSKMEIARIHEQFMQDGTVTDVITFPGDRDEGLAGEICVCPEVALDYARKNDLPFNQELSLYLAHGYLHLCGFDDQDQTQRDAMRDAETLAIETLVHHDALPNFSLDS